MLPVHTILHATDLTPVSQPAFQMACSLARDYGARLIVLHVAQPPLALYNEVGMYVPPPTNYRENALERLHRLAPPRTDVRVERMMLEGDVAEEILKFAEKAPCNIIVMGTHGRHGLGRILIGSVAEQVLRKAPCPVLLVRNPLPESVSESALTKEPALV
jgi:nucleotide-binding universal stress UspA family protein